jgi:PKD repeat protein
MSEKSSNQQNHLFFTQTIIKKKKQNAKISSYTPNLSLFVTAGLLLLVGISPAFQANTINNAANAVQNNCFFPCTDWNILIRNTPEVSQDEEWNRTYGRSNIDVGYDARQTTDGGYIITGYTRSYGAAGHNVWLIKTDSLGDMVWNKTFGGANDDEGQSVRQTTDGGYIIAGWTKSSGAGMKDLWLIKTDSLGNKLWERLYGGANDDGATCVQQTTDGGYIVTGYTSSYGTGSVDVWLIKTDSLGNQQWSKTLGGYGSDGAWCVQQTEDGGYIFTGWTYSYGPGYVGNVWFVKTDDLGNQQWNKTFGGTDVDRGYWVQQTTDGGYVITGYTASSGAGLDDMLLIKTDTSGNEEWSKTFGGTGRDYGNMVQQTIDGGYIIAGYTLSYGAGSEDVWLVKTDALGNEQWDRTYGGIYSDVGYSVQQTTDMGYIIAGYTLSYGAGVHDVWLIKIEGTGIPPLEVDAGGPYSGLVGDPIAFTGNVSGGIPPYTFHWDFGDNTTADVQSPSHVYTAAGVYEATFTVTDQNYTEATDTASVTIVQSDITPPNVTITKPLVKSLYLGNRRVLTFPITLLIGSINVAVNATDTDSGVSSVRFFLNGVLKSTDATPPYSWEWGGRVFGRYTILAEAFDAAGNNATAEVSVWRFF